MDTFISTVPDDLKEVYKKHWATIKPSVKKGFLKDMYHFPVSLGDNIPGKFDNVIGKYKKRVKVNIAFGYILRSKENGELKFYHPSNNTMVFERAQLVSNKTDETKLKEEIERDDLLEIANKYKPSSAWSVETIACIRFDIYSF